MPQSDKLSFTWQSRLSWMSHDTADSAGCHTALSSEDSRHETAGQTVLCASDRLRWLYLGLILPNKNRFAQDLLSVYHLAWPGTGVVQCVPTTDCSSVITGCRSAAIVPDLGPASSSCHGVFVWHPLSLRRRRLCQQTFHRPRLCRPISAA